MTQSRTFRLFLLLAGMSILLPPATSANFTVTVDAQYGRVLDQTRADIVHHWNGLGGVLYLEAMPTDFFSIGAALDFTTYFGVQDTTPDPTFSQYLDGVIRILPLGSSGRVSPYLLGTFGWNPNKTLQLPGITGDFHGQAGLGIRWLADPLTAMDFGFSLQAYSPAGDPFLLPSAHLGITLFTDPVPYKSKASQRLIPRFDSLQAIAAREYGNPDLYPILVDANFKDLAKPLTWKAGQRLVIPRPLTPEMMRDALLKARDPKYLRASDTFHDPYVSAEFRKEVRPSGSYWVPVTNKKRSSIRFHAESLYDIAARPDVFGDPELYPLLVDANRRALMNNYPDKPFNLLIPRATKEEVSQARLKAWSPEYGIWRGRDVTQKEYKEWREHNGRWVEP